MTITTARAQVQARALVTERMQPMRVEGQTIHVVGLPYHWGPTGVVTGDVVNDLVAVGLNPNVMIHESKAFTCDLQGSQVRGAAGVFLGPLFLAASVTSEAVALVLAGVLSGRQSREARRQIRVVANVTLAAQFGLAAAHEGFTTERINRPLRHGRWAKLFRYSAVGGGLFLPAFLRLAAWLSPKRVEPVISTAGALFTLAGILSVRIAIVEAAKESAADPLAYQDLTRGAPGEARPTPEQQARSVPHVPRFALGVSARDTVGAGDPGVR